MSIDVDDFYSKICSVNSLSDREAIKNYLSDIVNIFSSDSEPEIIQKKVNARFSKISNGISDTGLEVLDSIRHAFYVFSNQSVKDLYFHHENECWYPKILISKTIDVEELIDYESTFIIYRGCDKSELADNSYGQSWTVNKEVAKDFAYRHYQNQSWFRKTQRIVVKAEIDKSNIYLSRLWHSEQEVVINPFFLKNIRDVS